MSQPCERDQIYLGHVQRDSETTRRSTTQSNCDGQNVDTKQQQQQRYSSKRTQDSRQQVKSSTAYSAQNTNVTHNNQRRRTRARRWPTDKPAADCASLCAVLLLMFLASSADLGLRQLLNEAKLMLSAGLAQPQQLHSTNSFFLVQAFNLDTQSAVVHVGPANSYFGYSVAQHKDRGVNWLLVGAPKADTDQKQTRQPGAVYRCAPSQSKACQQILFDPNDSSVATLDGQQVQTDSKSQQWFGGSLQSATDNGSIIACASRYVYYSANLKRRDPVGTCWVSRGSFSAFLEYSPCRLNDQWGHHHLGSCQAGFSSAITRDGSRILMGAPGAHVWQGQVFAHNLRNDLTNTTSGVNPHSEDDSYLGYSLALGKFTGSPGLDSDAAIGIPRGNELAGKVMLVDREMRTLRNITGEQMGAYFGYSLAVADLNGDGLDDLVIGAPLHYNQTISHKEAHYERGRIYIVQQNMRHEMTIVQTIDGLKNRARFGTSLANAGDLNRDGIHDLVVGAPFDGPEGRGAVYVFMGSRRGPLGGASGHHDQVVYAEQIRHEGHLLRSFGFSLSAGLDTDSNQYPDVLVGDYEAGRAVLLRSRPIVNVTTSISFQPENFNLEDKKCLLPNSTQTVSCVTVQYCTKYSGMNADQRLTFVYDIKLDSEYPKKDQPRMFFLTNENKNEDRQMQTLTKDTNHCKTFKVYLTKQIRDKLTPLKIDIDYNLAEQLLASTDENPTGRLRPVLNKLEPNKISKFAMIQRNCGQDNVCIPDLSLKIDTNLDQYTVGSNENLVLDVVVRNNGEDAYESMFYLTMPMAINYITFNKTQRSTDTYPICYGAKPDQTGVNVISCDLGNPQAQNDVTRFSIITRPARGQFSSPDFTFVGQVNSTNPELDDRHREDNQVIIGIPIRVETQLVLSGNSQPPVVIHNFTHHQSVQQNKVVAAPAPPSSSFSSLASIFYGQPQQQQQQPLVVTNAGQPAPVLITKPVKLSEAELGPEVYHIYQLQNRGPSTIHDIAITILWPTKNSDGQYLLYLVDEPITSDNVKCQPAPDDAINPMNLKYLRGNSINLPSKVAASQYASQNQDRNNRFKRQTTQNSSLDETAVAMAQTSVSTVDNSILQQLNLLDCGPTQCTRFECNVRDLAHNEIASIRIRSRLDEDTINELSLREYGISSKLVAQVKSLPYNVSTQSMPPYVYKVETIVKTTGIAISDLLPWWLILLAIILGILLFILLVCFLKYLGFFARKRPPKGAEREPLTPNIWNDYQYTPGDTAL